MAKIPINIAQGVESFLNKVKQKKKLKAAYLYGSQARGIASEWSDIDIALVSDEFSEDLFEEELQLTRIAVQIDNRIEPKAFTSKDFNLNNPLAAEIQRTGIRVV